MRARKLRLFLRGEQIDNPVDHPLIKPSIRTVAETYRLAESPDTRDIAVAHSRFIDAHRACHETPSGTVMVDPMLANVCKHNVTRFTYEIGRLAEDLVGGLMATMPSAEDLEHPEIGPLLQSIIEAAEGSAEDRAKVLRLIESMTLGTTAVPLRTEAMHGAGSPQAQRLRIGQQADFPAKVELVKRVID